MSSDLSHQAAAAKARIARGERDPHLYNLAAWGQVERGDSEAALATLDTALALFPGDPQTLISIAVLHRRAGHLRDAVLACDAAISSAPAYVDAWLERAFVFTSGGSMLRARECYDQVLRLDPANSDAHAGLASIAARDGESAKARKHALTALARAPGNPTATLALATVELETGEADRARDLLEPLIAALPAPEPDRSLARTLLGDAWNRLGEPAKAFASYSAAKADFAEIHAAQFAGRPPHREFIAGISEALAEEAFASATLPELASGPSGHLFLLGYPRSGNTLVENILASLPGVVALEERPTLRAADRAFLSDPAGLSRLAKAPVAELATYRDAYWASVAQSGVDAAGRTFVDMDPLKGTRLPLIARFLPEARVVVMRRDPRDVVWSCFRTNFALTNAAMEFTTLERTARHFDAMMRLIETARERLPLAFHEVRYEELVADFEGTTRALCEFSGLAWDPAVRRFDRTAQRRGVATASGGQVRKGLFDGRRQWEPYGRWLEPVMPILEPWLARFGYT